MARSCRRRRSEAICACAASGTGLTAPSRSSLRRTTRSPLPPLPLQVILHDVNSLPCTRALSLARALSLCNVTQCVLARVHAYGAAISASDTAAPASSLTSQFCHACFRSLRALSVLYVFLMILLWPILATGIQPRNDSRSFAPISLKSPRVRYSSMKARSLFPLVFRFTRNRLRVVHHTHTYTMIARRHCRAAAQACEFVESSSLSSSYTRCSLNH
jgi:hypothetical protein